jgi:hypothetical protein
MICSFAELDKEKLDSIQSYEKTTGRTLLAFSCLDVNSEDLSEEELARVRDLEGKLGIVLVAVSKK